MKRKHIDVLFAIAIFLLFVAVVHLFFREPTVTSSTEKPKKVSYQDIEILEMEIKYLKKRNNYDLVTCEVCGCAIERDKAFEGPSVIKKRWVYQPLLGDYREEEYIGHNYYCKMHKPKEETKCQE